MFGELLGVVNKKLSLALSLGGLWGQGGQGEAPLHSLILYLVLGPGMRWSGDGMTNGTNKPVPPP